MALLDIRQRTGWLFMAVIVGHILLISAQVTPRAACPCSRSLTFGVFAEVQRGDDGGRSTACATSGTDYFALQQMRQENEQLKREVPQLQVGCSRSARSPSSRACCRSCST